MGKVCGAPPIVLGVLTTLFNGGEGNILNAEGNKIYSTLNTCINIISLADHLFFLYRRCR
jgi:hypothetical protein